MWVTTLQTIVAIIALEPLMPAIADPKGLCHNHYVRWTFRVYVRFFPSFPSKTPWVYYVMWVTTLQTIVAIIALEPIMPAIADPKGLCHNHYVRWTFRVYVRFFPSFPSKTLGILCYVGDNSTDNCGYHRT